MGFCCTASLVIFLSLVLQVRLDKPALAESASDYTALVYRGCGKEGASPGQYSEALRSLLDSLVAQSSQVKFRATNASAPVSGLFQCRGDLSNSECHDCVSQAQQMAVSVCGDAATAARVQFSGCYVLYSASGVSLNYGSELLYKACSATDVAGAGFEERRDMALQTMSDQVSKTHGFYATVFESVYVLAQCEGDVDDGDCGECVKTAVQKAQVECGSSIGGEAYLDKCFITYSYTPNGVPKTASVSSSTGSTTNKRTTADFILICAAVAGTVVVCMVLARSRRKK
uniref:Gnk2-homologous domain-containing protein n=1 Tax=Kalanchoe fedtschenkoi TaxID=63787 RepID=A0A7N0U614_KALFE